MTQRNADQRLTVQTTKSRKSFRYWLIPSASWLHLFVKTHEILGKKIGKRGKSSARHTGQRASGNSSSPSPSHYPQGHFKHKGIIHYHDRQFSPTASNIPVFVGKYILQHLDEGMKLRAGVGSRVSLLLKAASLVKITLQQSPVWPFST